MQTLSCYAAIVPAATAAFAHAQGQELAIHCLPVGDGSDRETLRLSLKRLFLQTRLPARRSGCDPLQVPQVILVAPVVKKFHETGQPLQDAFLDEHAIDDVSSFFDRRGRDGT